MKAELARWTELWHSPQAAAWEALSVSVTTIARYVRFAVLAETSRPKITDTLHSKVMTEARLLEKELGLTAAAMKTLGWEIVDAEPEDSTGDGDVVELDAFRARVAGAD